MFWVIVSHICSDISIYYSRVFDPLSLWRMLVSWAPPETTAALTVAPATGSSPPPWRPPAGPMSAPGPSPLWAAGANWWWWSNYRFSKTLIWYLCDRGWRNYADQYWNVYFYVCLPSSRLILGSAQVCWTPATMAILKEPNCRTVTEGCTPEPPAPQSPDPPTPALGWAAAEVNDAYKKLLFTNLPSLVSEKTQFRQSEVLIIPININLNWKMNPVSFPGLGEKPNDPLDSSWRSCRLLSLSSTSPSKPLLTRRETEAKYEPSFSSLGERRTRTSGVGSSLCT